MWIRAPNIEDKAYRGERGRGPPVGFGSVKRTNYNRRTDS